VKKYMSYPVYREKHSFTIEKYEKGIDIEIINDPNLPHDMESRRKIVNTVVLKEGNELVLYVVIDRITYERIR
jgi:hypothetical protein